MGNCVSSWDLSSDIKIMCYPLNHWRHPNRSYGVMNLWTFLNKYLSVGTEEVSQCLQPSVKHCLGSKLNSEPRKQDFCYLENIFLIKKQWLTNEASAAKPNHKLRIKDRKISCSVKIIPSVCGKIYKRYIYHWLLKDSQWPCKLYFLHSKHHPCHPGSILEQTDLQRIRLTGASPPAPACVCTVLWVLVLFWKDRRLHVGIRGDVARQL